MVPEGGVNMAPCHHSEQGGPSRLPFWCLQRMPITFRKAIRR
ncbi:hypothetical protein SynA1825c_01456 [Synechococcus sp. A18-25c]|nr:hypothetical protein SynA1825c_01456 [Synechococcus sp. A18-25c]